MMVMMIASTPSLNASSLAVFKRRLLGSLSQRQRAG
jgi:hypothetical protein